MKNLKIILLFVIITMTWSTTWMAMSLSVETIPPLTATGLRFLIASPILLVLACLTRAPLLFQKGERKIQVFITLGYFCVPFSLMMYGERYVSSGLTALIFSNMPAVILLLSVVLLSEKIRLRKALGLILSTTSLAFILFLEMDWSSRSRLIGLIALMSALILHGFAYTLMKRKCASIPVLTFNTLPCAAAAMMLLSAGAFIERPSYSHFSAISLISTAYLGVVASVFGIICFFLLQKQVSAFRASLIFLIFPILAIGLDEHLNHKSFSLLSWVLLVPLTLGVALILKPPTRWSASTRSTHRLPQMSENRHARKTPG